VSRLKGSISSEEHRARIKTAAILARLNHFVLGTKNGDDHCVMTSDQVKAAIALLKKTIPDLQTIEATLRGDDKQPIVFSITDKHS